MPLHAPLFIELLADRQLNPAALLLRPSPGMPSALLEEAPLTSALAEMAHRWPCFLPTEGTPAPEQQATLLAAGCREPPGARQLVFADAPCPPPLRENTEWIGGRWFLAPQPVSKGQHPPSRALALRLLHLVTSDADTCDIEAVFRQDPVLAYHLLRLVNSLGVGVGRHISSFAQAILILGRQQLKRWINLMLFAANRDDPRAPMLLAFASVRARTVELLAQASGLERSVQEQAFMVGLFSLLGTLFGEPLETLLARLSLPPATVGAVLRRERALGGMLNAVEFGEQHKAEALRQQLDALGLDLMTYTQAQLEAHAWMACVVHDAQGKRHG